MYYVGAKWAQDADPSNFMKPGGYETSSETIKSLIEQHGLSVFVVRKIRVFETADEAQKYETRFLRRVNARNHPKFYNGHNNDGAMDPIKMKIVMMESHGVENCSQIESVKSKKRDTVYKNYGVDNPLKSDQIRAKVRQTNLDRYGVDHPLKSDQIRAKVRQTNLDRYGVDNYLASEDGKEKTRRTMNAKFGADTNLQLEEVVNSRKKVMLELYGVEYGFQSSEIREKSLKTINDVYGGHQMRNPDVKQKYRTTSLERYGTEHPNQRSEYREDRKNRNIFLRQREVVTEIKRYKDFYLIKLGSGWTMKAQEDLEFILAQLIEKYGVL